MRRVNPAFGAAVGRLLDEHGLSLRAARIRTGIDHVTLSDMRAGYVPKLEQVERLARGFGLNVNTWRTLAGYEPVLPHAPPGEVTLRELTSGAEILWEGVKRLEAEYDEPDIRLRFYAGLASLTPEDARLFLVHLESELKAERAEQQAAPPRAPRPEVAEE